LFILPNLLL